MVSPPEFRPEFPAAFDFYAEKARREKSLESRARAGEMPLARYRGPRRAARPAVLASVCSSNTNGL
jgi:hypothetical protein